MPAKISSGWDALRLKNTHLQLDAAVLDIALIELARPFAKLVIAADASTNFSALQTEQASASETTAPARPVAMRKISFTIKIGKTTIADGSMDFSDFSLPLPFKAPISELGGSISTLATDTTQPSEIDLEGKVAKYGFVSITGTASLMAPTEQTAVEAKFRNVDMPSLSPYTAEFAGRKIASGKLDLDLNYTLDKEQMAGENKIVIETFELGEKVENPDAMDLPLDLAVALLKDMNGVIDLELGVSGDMNDPSFSASGIVLKAFANLITKAAAAPFKLLGSLIPGGGETDFDAVEFQAGRADLMPPEQQKLDQLGGGTPAAAEPDPAGARRIRQRIGHSGTAGRCSGATNGRADSATSSTPMPMPTSWRSKPARPSRNLPIVNCPMCRFGTCARNTRVSRPTAAARNSTSRPTVPGCAHNWSRFRLSTRLS